MVIVSTDLKWSNNGFLKRSWSCPGMKEEEEDNQELSTDTLQPR
jgi:hypothetical protein